MATFDDKYTCKVCKKLYTHPIVHKLCGISFDRQCIGEICPTEGCGQAIKEDDLTINYTLLKIVDEYRFRLETPLTYYIILLDTSNSMWYSDTLLPFAMGESRFTYAKQFLSDFFNLHMNSEINKVSLITFDTGQLQRFDFETIGTSHLTMLQNLSCEGKDTALFDSIDFCLNRFEQLAKDLHNGIPNSYLIVLTDGGNNFGKKDYDHAAKVSWRSGKLQISGHMVQIGDKNRRKTRVICDYIKYKYNHFNGGNVKEFADSFANILKTETRSRVSQLRATATPVSQVRAINSTDAWLINQLPDVPTKPIKVSSKQLVEA